VAFSRNEFRCRAGSSGTTACATRAGLGTRAVDRLKDDYPMLLAPPAGLRVNVTPGRGAALLAEEGRRHQPRDPEFEDVEIADLLRRHAPTDPAIQMLVSTWRAATCRTSRLGPDFERDELVVTFDGLIRQSPFIGTMRSLLRVLEEALERPSTWSSRRRPRSLLVQCRRRAARGIPRRPASARRERGPDPLHGQPLHQQRPRPGSATSSTSTGEVQRLGTLEEMRAVGRRRGRLNTCCRGAASS